ncbi:hypothetical protein ABZ725_32740 [Streptomyces sp. NPDC006872]|uniref:hypothetical protein n=1 Tax=Streptomyces sp. NPDC006872 TaxID=3155720 RepID=UPI0033EBDB4D
MVDGRWVGDFSILASKNRRESRIGLLCEVLRRPEVRDRLIADPDLIPAAVEEALRLHPPVCPGQAVARMEMTVAAVSVQVTSVALCQLSSLGTLRV